MAEKPASFSLQDLLGLVRNRKFKDFAGYIREIENMNQTAEQSVAVVLETLLVKKTEKNPTVMLSALMLYKTLMVGACFDFSFSDDCFPMRVHDEVIRICEYRPQIEAFSSRGSDYFSDLFKVAKTEQNRETFERSGNSYVLMALELVQAMAGWYPQDFFNPKSKSFFKAKYDELVAKKITFPKKDQLLIIKKVDEDNFKANYQRFKKRMEEIDEAESPKKEAPKLSSPPPPPPVKKEQVPPPPVQSSKDAPKSQMVGKKAPGNSLNIQPSNLPAVQGNDELIRIQGEMKSAFVSKPIAKNDPSMIDMKEQNILQTNDLVGSGKAHPTLSQNSHREIKPQNKDPPPAPKVSLPIKAEESKEKREVFERSDSEGEQSSQKVSLKKVKKQQTKAKEGLESLEIKPSVVSSKAVEEPKAKVKASEIKPQPSKEIPQKSQPPPPIREKQPSVPSVSVSVKPQPIKKQQKALPKEEKLKQPIVAESVVKEVFSQRLPAKEGLLKNENTLNIKQTQEIESPFSFNQREFGQTVRKEQTPRKIAKTEKSGVGVASLPISPNRQKPLPYPVQEVDVIPSKRPRSLPKTEKRTATGLNFFNPKVCKQFQYLDTAPVVSKQFNKTLSYWAQNRPRNLPSKQLQKSLSVNAILQEMRLDQRRLPFIAKYYEPITSSMHALRAESLTLLNSGSSGNQFFSNGTLECRLVKENDCVFTLSLQNVSAEPMLVEYCEMKGLKHSNRIKILSWANRPQIAAYEVPRKGFMDIKFRFSVTDLNFKFLTFLLRINGRVEALVLPVTLLDMCELSPINHPDLYRYSLTGCILASEPFLLADRLPHFLGGFRFSPLSNSRTKRQQGQIVGECSLRLQGSGEGEEGGLEVLVRVVDWQERLVEVDVLHVSKDQYCEDLAKVVLYLLVFLLKNQ